MLDRKLRRELWHMRGPVLAIALVATGGIATMVMAVSNHAALATSRAVYYGEYRFADVFAGVRRAPLPLLAEIRILPGVREAQARVVVGAKLDVPGSDEPLAALFVSLPRAGDPDLNRVFLRRGRLAAADDEVVLVESFATAHGLEPGDPLVAVLNGRHQALRIAGIGLSPEFIYPIQPGELFPDFERFAVLWMPHEPLARAFDLAGAFNDVVLTLDRGAVEQDVLAELDDLLRPYGGTGAFGRELQHSHRVLQEELTQLRLMGQAFTLVFLAVTAFLLNIVVGRVIASQREQIALLKAFGYGNGRVALHYGQLALAMVAVGVPPGMVLGAWFGHGLSVVYAKFYTFPHLVWRMEPWLLAASVAFAAVGACIGVAAGLWRVLRLQPAEALRPEAPPLYRRSLAERVLPSRLLGPAGRMIVRNLERRPLRSLLTLAGIALAGGILVAARFQTAAIDELVDVQFGLVQRDDLAVGFVEPTSGRVALDLASLPGVRQVEPFRNAPVELRRGHRHYRTSVLGLPDGARLRQVLDRELRPQALPGEGLLLTGHLADMLGVRPGDPLEVTFLGGQRRTVSVPVAGVASEYIGVGAYARLETLNRLLIEGDVVSGVWLTLDAPHRADVVRALRQAPRVAAVSDRAATVSGFLDTLGRTVLAFTVVITLLAASICIGVVYNAARITLAERGRELASLRVLGYTRGEVRTLLLGELFLLAFLALLPGALSGWGLVVLLVQAFQTDLYRIPLVVAPAGFAFAALVVLAATAASALLVRRRLDHLDLVAVLKSRE